MKKILSHVLVAVGLVLTVPYLSTAQQISPGGIKKYTSDADFGEGLKLSVNSGISGSLRLDQPNQPLPYVNIPCSGRGTLVRIHVGTGAIIGEYTTAPADMKKNPSRTTVDKFGNTWVTNRDEDGLMNGMQMGSVTRIGITIGGTRTNASGQPEPNGQYLKPPFLYNTCVDRNGDGLIKTSKGLGDVLEWTNAGGANTFGGVSTAEDESVITYTRVLATGARTVAIDENNDVWIGGSNNFWHEKLDGQTGNRIPGTEFNLGAGGYGGLIDGNGILWSAGPRDGNPLLRYDTKGLTSPPGQVLYGKGDYGVGIDPNTGEVWSTTFTEGIVYKLDAAGNILGSFPHGNQFAQGVAVDAFQNVWIAHSLVNGFSVGHLKTDGTFVGNVQLNEAGPTGVAVDAFGNVWVSNYSSNSVSRINPNAGPIGNGGYPIGAVDLTIPLGANANPYTYSDMTGFVVLNCTVPSGSWTVVHDGQEAGRKWGEVEWNAVTPDQTGIKVEVRASDQLLTLAEKSFITVQNREEFCCSGVTGRYVEMRVSLFRQALVSTTPLLNDITIKSCDIYTNQLPSITSSIGCNPLDTIRIIANDSKSFSVSGNDPDQDQVIKLTAKGLPSGAQFTTEVASSGNGIDGSFSWTPLSSQLGVYPISFTTSDKYCYEAKCNKVIKVVNCFVETSISASIPAGGTYEFNGQTLSSSGVYFATLFSRIGCDSVVALNLTVLDPNEFSVICYQQGPTRNGGVVSLVRSNPENATRPEMTDVQGPVNFFSLGYRGFISLKSNYPVLNGPGNDITVYETTWGNPSQYPSGERAHIYASQDGANFIYLGLSVYNGSFDLGALPWAQYFRIQDATNPENSEDAFDLDGIRVLNGFSPSPSLTPTALFGPGLVTYCGGVQGKQNNKKTIPAIRNDVNKALGTTQQDDTYNFYSLGFGGDACYKFGYSVFDQAGADIRVIETSFGNPSCNSYPEKVEVSVSYDGQNWNNLGILCLDGTIDLGAVNSGIGYIKFKDVSDKLRFNGSADGFDLDGAISLNSSAPGSGGTNCGGSNARMAISAPISGDVNNVPDELTSLQLNGNVASFSMASSNGVAKVTDNLGRVLFSMNVESEIWSNVDLELPIQGLSTGVYMLSVETTVSRDVIKFVK